MAETDEPDDNEKASDTSFLGTSVTEAMENLINQMEEESMSKFVSRTKDKDYGSDSTCMKFVVYLLIYFSY